MSTRTTSLITRIIPAAWRSILCVSALCFFTAFVSGWFDDLNQQPISLDEVAWVNDAVVYEWRASGDWEKFVWSGKGETGEWASREFRLFDQPHLIKYVFGFFFTKADAKPWTDALYHEENYKQFIEQRFSGMFLLSDPRSGPLFGEKTVAAIRVGRVINTVFAYAFFVVLCIFLSRVLGIVAAGLITSIVLLTPTFLISMRFATADSLSMLMILLTVVTFAKLFFDKPLTQRAHVIILIISAVLAALAAATKINGWFFVVMFIFLTAANKARLHIKGRDLLIWLGIFLSIFTLLQPELWVHSFQGFVRLFSIRLYQQDQFVEYLGKMNVVEYHLWLVKLFVESQVPFVWMVKTIGLIVGTLLIGYQVIQAKKTKRWWLYSALFLLAWGFFFFYARVGFLRYAIWPLMFMAVAVGFGLAKPLKRS